LNKQKRFERYVKYGIHGRRLDYFKSTYNHMKRAVHLAANYFPQETGRELKLQLKKDLIDPAVNATVANSLRLALLWTFKDQLISVVKPRRNNLIDSNATGNAQSCKIVCKERISTQNVDLILQNKFQNQILVNSAEKVVTYQVYHKKKKSLSFENLHEINSNLLSSLTKHPIYLQCIFFVHDETTYFCKVIVSQKYFARDGLQKFPPWKEEIDKLLLSIFDKEMSNDNHEVTYFSDSIDHKSCKECFN
jgi:hypothetical protein